MIKNTKKKSAITLTLDFGSHSVKCLLAQRNHEKIKVFNMFSVPLSAEVYENGNILNEASLVLNLRDAFVQNKIKAKETAVTIESTEILKRELTIAHVPVEDRLDLIKYEISQYLPIDLDDYVIQYKVIEEILIGESNMLQVQIAAMPKRMAEAYYNLIKKCGLKPILMDLHSHALEKFVAWNFSNVPDYNEKTLVFVDFGHSMLDINLIDKGHLIFSRSINMGGKGFDKIIAANLSIEDSKAEEKKCCVDIIKLQEARHEAQMNALGLEAPNPKDVILSNFADYLDECLDELNKVLKYYTSRSIENKIDYIYLYGGSSQFKGLAEYVSERFEIGSEILKPLDRIEFSSKVKDPNFPKYIHTVGALLEC